MAVLIIGGFGLFRFLPLYKTIKTVKHIRNEQRLVIAKGISDSEQLSLFTDQLLQLKVKLGNYENNIPRQKTLGSFVRHIADLINQHQLKEQEIAPRAETSIDGLSCIPVSIQCRGELKQIFKFYQQLQESDRMIRIQRVKLVNDGDFRGDVSMETDVVIYYRTETVQG